MKLFLVIPLFLLASKLKALLGVEQVEKVASEKLNEIAKKQKGVGAGVTPGRGRPVK